MFASLTELGFGVPRRDECSHTRPDSPNSQLPTTNSCGAPRRMNLLIFIAGTALAIVAARPVTSVPVRRAATTAVFALMASAPFVSSSTSILFDALTAMCIAYGWNVIGGYTGYAAFGNVAYLGLGAFVASGLLVRQP